MNVPKKWMVLKHEPKSVTLRMDGLINLSESDVIQEYNSSQSHQKSGRNWPLGGSSQWVSSS